MLCFVKKKYQELFANGSEQHIGGDLDKPQLDPDFQDYQLLQIVFSRLAILSGDEKSGTSQ